MVRTGTDPLIDARSVDGYSADGWHAGGEVVRNSYNPRMKTFSCVCGSRLFFSNTQCANCNRLVGYWHAIRAVVPLEPAQAPDAWPDWQVYTSTLPELESQRFVLDQNRRQFGVGNEIVAWDPDDSRAAPQQPLAVSGRLNATIPNLDQDAMRLAWTLLETAKRRLLYTIDQLAIPYGVDPSDPFPLRHEFAHYAWQRLVQGRGEPAFIARFGDHNTPSYANARDRYYAQGPPPDWRDRFISAYAAMHPWEDFAETFAFYLDMHETLETAHHFGFTTFNPLKPGTDLDASLRAYTELGIAVNEINRGMGLLDIVPEILVEPVIDKLRYISRLIDHDT